MTFGLQALQNLFQGVVPSVVATCSADGEPNVTYLSQVDYVDANHVALSCQFFNKTTRNVAENPFVALVLYDPITFEAWRMRARFVRSEDAGPLFDTMAARIQAIASHTGMTGVFRLLSADVYEVLSFEKDEGYLLPPDPTLDALPGPAAGGGPLTELRGLQIVSERVARACDRDELVRNALTTLDELLGFSHSMVLLHDAQRGRLVQVASRGYDGRGLGAEVGMGEGLIGTVAERGRMLRMASIGGELRYGRAIRDRAQELGQQGGCEVPLPGLAHVQAQLALPLLAGERLVGVLAVESADPLCFDEWDEAFLQIVANQIALGLDRLQPVQHATPPANGRKVRRFVFYRNDDCVFVDGEYLVRNVPAKILWKLLRQHRDAGRSDFTNRELRLDPALGLPPIKDNLESRLILLRKRLIEKCPEVRLVPSGRGRFTLELDAELSLVEKESA